MLCNHRGFPMAWSACLSSTPVAVSCLWKMRTPLPVPILSDLWTILCPMIILILSILMRDLMICLPISRWLLPEVVKTFHSVRGDCNWVLGRVFFYGSTGSLRITANLFLPFLANETCTNQNIFFQSSLLFIYRLHATW